MVGVGSSLVTHVQVYGGVSIHMSGVQQECLLVASFSHRGEPACLIICGRCGTLADRQAPSSLVAADPAEIGTARQVSKHVLGFN